MCKFKLFVVLCWSVLGCSNLAESFDLYWSKDSSIIKIANIESTQTPTTIYPGTTQSQSQIIGLGVDISAGLLFWTDLSSTQKGIWKSDLNGQKGQRILDGDDVGVGQPTGLAVDWVNKVLYWTDPDQRTVEICDYNGTKRLTLITHGLSHPRGIVSDPINGFLYIGDQDLHQIHKCKLDGKNCTVWNPTGLSGCTFWPNQLSINHINGRLYWADGWSSSVCSCTLDGKSCSSHNITQGRETNVFGVGLMQRGGNTVLYHSGLHNSTVSVLNGSRNSVLFAAVPTSKSYFMVSTDKDTTQPNGNSPCSTANCSDICVPRDNVSHSCACPSYSTKVMINGQNCGTPDDILLYADTLAGEVGMISAALKPIEGVSHPTTLIARAENPVAVTFDTINNEVYFSDIGTSTIEKVRLDGTSRQVFLNDMKGIDQVEGLAIDTKQRRLYFSNHGYTTNDSVAFWHKIEMISLDRKQRRSVITDVKKPRGIWIDSDQRYLLYTDWGSTPKVRRSTLDGLEITDVGTQLIAPRRPNGVAVIEDRIFIVDSDTPLIEFISPGGSSKGGISVPSGLVFPFGLTGNSNNLYVSDAGDSAGKNSRLHFISINRTVVNATISGFQRLTGIHFVKKTSKYRQDLGFCSDSQNPCGAESICTTKLKMNTATCLCQSNKLNYLTTDRKTCTRPKYNYMLIADVDGLKMASLESDPHVYTIRHGSGKCGHFKGLTLDRNGKKIYYAGAESGKIYKANIDGTKEEELMEHEHRIEHISYNNDKLFWTSLYGCNGTMGGVYQWNLDPQSQPIEIQQNVSKPRGIAANARNVYWSDETGINVYDLTKNSFQVIQVPQDVNSVTSLSLDDLGTLYISSSNGRLVARKFPTQDLRPGLAVDEGYLMTDEGIFVSGKFVYMVTSSKQVKLFDRLTKRNQTKKLDKGSLARPGQIIVIQDSNEVTQQQQEKKPGVCSSLMRNCSTSIYDCNSDLVCGGDQKCCHSNTQSCSTAFCEVPSLGSDTCQLNVEGFQIKWSTQNGKYSDKCRECDCANPNCLLICPTLTCPVNEQVSGGCCPVCSSIQKCSEAPKISNCPTEQKTINLPADKANVMLNRSILNIENIAAQSCDSQPIKLSDITPSSVTWKAEPQKIKLTAEDKHGIKTCEFQLQVNDVTPPVITYCPESVEGIAKSDEGLRVEWLEPQATDNSGHVKIETGQNSRLNGDKFPVGSDIVDYIARDGANNVNDTCKFTVTIIKKEISCEELPIVQNGVLSCDSSGGKTACHIQKCNKGYVLLPDHNKTYECSADGVWQPAFPPLFKLEACFKPEPVEITLQFIVMFVNCPNTNFNKNDLINCLSIASVCPAPEKKISLCQGDRLTIDQSGDGSVTVRGDTMGEYPFGGDLNAVVNDIQQANMKVVKFFQDKTYETLCPKIACSIDINNTGSQSEVKQSCPVGSQYHANVNGKPACMPCSPGKFFDEPLKECKKCAVGSYQEQPGQLECLMCKTGTTTRKEAAYREAHCIKVTPPPQGPDAGLIVGLVVVLLLIIVIALGVVFLIKRRRQREANGKGQYESSVTKKDQRVSDVYDELNEDEYHVIPADHVTTYPDTGNDGYAMAKDVPKAENDGYMTPNDMQKDRALPDPYAQLGSKKTEETDYEGLLNSPYEKLQANKEKEETYTNPVYTGDTN